MNKAQQKKFDSLYQQHVNALHRQGKAATTIDVYSRAVRRITEYYDMCPDRLTLEQLKEYFSALVKSHSWSTVKVDRNGLQFFYKYTIHKEWVWVDIVKLPQKKVLPDILTVKEVERIINGTRELRYQAFIFTAYSMGLRLGEALNLQVGDIDKERMNAPGEGQKRSLCYPAEGQPGCPAKILGDASPPQPALSRRKNPGTETVGQARHGSWRTSKIL